MSKISIRFYKDRQVRAIWDDEHSKWWFSAIDIIRAINEEPDYVKAGNYWRWLKKKFKKEGIQLVSVTHELKFEAPDGKKRASSIDGRSKKKAYTLIESNLVADKDVGTVKALQQIHAYIFGGLYDFAGKIRTKTITSRKID